MMFLLNYFVTDQVVLFFCTASASVGVKVQEETLRVCTTQAFSRPLYSSFRPGIIFVG
jgi:hypothetical protein